MRRVEAQLRQAQKMEAIGQLTGGIAHDFNNLLTAVIGNLELLQSRLSDQRSRSLAEAALRSALRGGQLTQQLLAYARRQNLSPRPVDVNAVIAGMGELLQRSLGGLVQVVIDLAPDAWPATSDPTQLELVVLNLAINAETRCLLAVNCASQRKTWIDRKPLGWPCSIRATTYGLR